MDGKKNGGLKRRRISTSDARLLAHRRPSQESSLTQQVERDSVGLSPCFSTELFIISVFCQPLSVASALIRTRRFVREYRRIGTTVHFNRFRRAFLRTIGMCPLESPLYRFDVSFDTRMTIRSKISLINCPRQAISFHRSNYSGVCREITYL